MKRFVFFLLVVACAVQLNAQNYVHKHQADFLFGFARLLEWQSYDNEGITVDILGSEKITEQLNLLGKNNLVGGRKFVAKNITANSEIKCNIIFIDKQSSFLLDYIMPKIVDKNILIVTEDEDLIFRGADVALSKRNSTVGTSSMTYIYNRKSIENKNIKAAIEFYGYGKNVDFRSNLGPLPVEEE